MGKVVLGILGAIVIIGVISAGAYNSLISQSTAIDGQWAQVETQYQRRFDLIPNLVNATKGFMEQEKGVFDRLAEARGKYAGAGTPTEKIAAAGEVESALSRLLLIVENYPNLKSNETVAKLMDELAGTENRITVERRRYNELVQSYDGSIQRVPMNIFARLFGFSLRPYFESAPGSDKAPEVKL